MGREIAPDWQRADDSITREMKRAEHASERGALAVYLADLSPRLSFEGSTLSFDDPEPEHIELAGRRLILAPMFAGPRILNTGFDHPDFVSIGCPVPGLFGGPQGGDPVDPLVELLGSTRATLMLSLGRPRSVGDLAALLNVSPASITFHCDRLAASGLIRRERRGQHVNVARTSRGDELIDLMCGNQ